MALFTSTISHPLIVGSGHALLAHPSPIIPPPKSAGPGSERFAPVPGFAFVPPKLVQRIRRGDYIEMREMLPDAWQSLMDDQSCCRDKRPRRGGLITDILLWTQGYAALVAILATVHPDKIAHFMAYLKTITHASRNYGATAWASYDAAYSRQAAACGFYDWAVIDSALYNEAFTGRALTIPHCRYCLSETHSSNDCVYAPSDEMPYAKVPPPLPSTSSTHVTGDQPRASGGVELCGLFNKADGNQCNYKFCRYAHICSKCRKGPHPASECGKHGTARPPRQRQALDRTRFPPATTQ